MNEEYLGITRDKFILIWRIIFEVDQTNFELSLQRLISSSASTYQCVFSPAIF